LIEWVWFSVRKCHSCKNETAAFLT